jgi:protein-S-isoprenylcysteine O-methyltransferase Ste14
MTGEAQTTTAADLALPVLVAGVIPLLLAIGDPWRRPLEIPSVVVGAILVVSGVAIVARTVRDVAAIGAGAPTRPPHHLVTTGLFAHCRNPRYLGLLAVLAGLAMASRSPLLGLYLLTAAVGLHLRVVRHDEPLAERTFGPDWYHYRRAVPRWFPRLTGRTARR